MKRRDFLKAMVAVPAVVAVPALAKPVNAIENSLFTGEIGKIEGVSFYPSIESMGYEEGDIVEISGSINHDGFYQVDTYAEVMGRRAGLTLNRILEDLL